MSKYICSTVICTDKDTKKQKKYPFRQFMDQKSEVGIDCPLKPKTVTATASILIHLLEGDIVQSGRYSIELEPLKAPQPARVYIEIEGGVLTFVGQDRGDTEVYVMDWDNAMDADAEEEDKRTHHFFTAEVLATEEEVQAYIARTVYKEGE